MIDAFDEQLVEHTLATVFEVIPDLRNAVEFTHASLDPTSPVQYAADFMSAAGQNTAVEFGNRAARNLIRAM